MPPPKLLVMSVDIFGCRDSRRGASGDGDLREMFKGEEELAREVEKDDFPSEGHQEHCRCMQVSAS